MDIRDLEIAILDILNEVMEEPFANAEEARERVKEACREFAEAR